MNSVLVNAAGGNINITLPTAVGASFLCYNKRIDSTGNVVNILTTGGQTIDNSSEGIQFQYTAVQAKSDNANWWIV